MKMDRNLIFLIIIAVSSFTCVNCKHQAITANAATEEERLVARELSRVEKQFENYEFDPDSTFVARVKEPPDFVMNYIRDMDEMKYSSYNPSKEELNIIEEAFKYLPPVHKKILKERVLGVYFIDSFLGSGMADWVADHEKNVYCTLFFNPIIFKMNISEWLTYKEKTCFIKDSEAIDIVINGGTASSAFLGILLHESTHIVDYVKNITPFVEHATRAISVVKGQRIHNKSFVEKIWKDIKLPVEDFDYSQRNEISFYGLSKGPKINISSAEDVYRQFSLTPFVSLYGSMSWSEDLAEFLTFYHLTQKLKQPYMISVLKNKRIVYSYEPMKSRKVRKRFSLMEDFYR